MASDEPIVEAVKNGDLQTVKTILAQDPSKLNATDESKYTALHWACIRAHWDVAEYLIEKGADLNVVGGDGRTQIIGLSIMIIRKDPSRSTVFYQAILYDFEKVNLNMTNPGKTLKQ